MASIVRKKIGGALPVPMLCTQIEVYSFHRYSMLIAKHHDKPIDKLDEYSNFSFQGRKKIGSRVDCCSLISNALWARTISNCFWTRAVLFSENSGFSQSVVPFLQRLYCALRFEGSPFSANVFLSPHVKTLLHNHSLCSLLVAGCVLQLQ